MEGRWLLHDKTGVFYPVLRQNWSKAAPMILSGEWGREEGDRGMRV